MPPPGEPRSEQVVLITGASSGMGLTCARHLACRGYRVYGASRSPRQLGEAEGFRWLEMDVRDDASVERAIASVLAVERGIDVLVNNAGYGLAGAVEDTSPAEARAQFETNVFGPLRLTRAVLPQMRQRRAGLVVNMSSIAGLVPLPFQAFYSASKAALESFTEALRLEVRPFGIRVALLEPGDFRTGFTASRTRVAAAAASSVYHERFLRAMAVTERHEQAAGSPAAVAWMLERLISQPSPSLRRRVGNRRDRWAPTLRRILPEALYESLMMERYDAV